MKTPPMFTFPQDLKFTLVMISYQTNTMKCSLHQTQPVDNGDTIEETCGRMLLV